ncbi:MAG: tryptophan--tRNA ligase [Elusimicrobia bacterium]|nr:tryptophan--tRNA ligase [Elusimicrobiota bacterium]
MKKGRILSGMRPTGAMHLGHLFGALENWVKLQNEYETFYMVADWHAMTTQYDDTSRIKDSIRDMVADWIACGIDPEKSCVFKQSEVAAHCELFLVFSMITPLGWLERCPTYKEMKNEIKNHDLNTFGFLGYPVLQAADILIYKAGFVPVGEDQLPHLEITREIARRFNHFYGKLFPEPKAILAEAPKLAGTDGRKMSKSYGNAITLADRGKILEKKIKRLVTDPARIHPSDKGHPEVCSVFQYWKAAAKEKATEIKMQCEKAKIGCVECKKALSEKMAEILDPIQEKREKISGADIDEILKKGGEKAKTVAEKTMAEVREAVKI